MCRELTPWEKAVEFHGHTCPGLALGYRLAVLALEKLEASRSPDEQLVAVVENDTCAVDAIQVITGCTLGKGNLIFKDYGKMAATFYKRLDDEGWRISVKYRPKNDGMDELRRQVTEGTASAEEKERWQKHQEKKIEAILNAPAEELLSVARAGEKAPPRARLFRTVQCASCGEGVMEARAGLQEGQLLCPCCCEDYPVRWKS